MNGEVVGEAGPAAIAAYDVGPGVVLLDEVRLRRPEWVRGDRCADRPSHGSSSISQPWRPPALATKRDRYRSLSQALGN
jgi:hypothetical protein